MSGQSKGPISHHAAAGGRWTAFSAVVVVLVQFTQLAVLGRLLQPTDFGVMAMLMVVIGLFSLVADLGITNFIVQAKSFTAKHFGSFLALCLFASAMLGGCLLFLSPSIARYYKSPVLETLLPVTVFMVVAFAIGQIFFALLQREMRFRSIAIGEVVSNTAGLVVSILFALWGNGVRALIMGQWTVAVAKLGFYGVAAIAMMQPRLSWNMPELIAPLKFGSFQMGERLLNYVSWNIDKFLIGRVLGEINLGLYSVAYQLMVRPFSILNPIFTRVALPLFSRIQEDNARLCRGYLKLTRTVAIISFPVYIVLIVSAEAIIFLLMGPQWGGAADLLRILGILGFVYALGNPIGTLLVAKGRADLGLYYNIIAFVVYAVFLYIGIYFGPMGAAIALVLAAIGILFPLEFLLRWHLVRMPAGDYLSAIGKICMAAVSAIAIAASSSPLLDSALGAIAGSAVKGAIALTMYSVFIWFFENGLIKETYHLIRHK